LTLKSSIPAISGLELCLMLTVYSTPSRVRHPVAAGHKLPLDAGPERIAHPTVTAGDARSVGNGLADRVALLSADLAHGPDRNDQVQRLELFHVLKGRQRVRHLDLEPFLLERAPEHVRDLFRLVTEPATPHDQCFSRHILRSSTS